MGRPRRALTSPMRDCTPHFPVPIRDWEDYIREMVFAERVARGISRALSRCPVCGGAPCACPERGK